MEGIDSSRYSRMPVCATHFTRRSDNCTKATNKKFNNNNNNNWRGLLEEARKANKEEEEEEETLRWEAPNQQQVASHCATSNCYLTCSSRLSTPRVLVLPAWKFAFFSYIGEGMHCAFISVRLQLDYHHFIQLWNLCQYSSSVTNSVNYWLAPNQRRWLCQSNMELTGWWRAILCWGKAAWHDMSNQRRMMKVQSWILSCKLIPFNCTVE